MKYRCRIEQFGKMWEKAMDLQMAYVTAHNALTKKKELQLSKDVSRLELCKRVGTALFPGCVVRRCKG